MAKMFTKEKFEARAAERRARAAAYVSKAPDLSQEEIDALTAENRAYTEERAKAWADADASRDPAEELRTSLRVAASTAMQFGATQAQIDMIVSLAIEANDFNVLSGGRLTKADASHIIDSLR